MILAGVMYEELNDLTSGEFEFELDSHLLQDGLTVTELPQLCLDGCY